MRKTHFFLIIFTFQRQPGHDWCIIKLGVSGKIVGFELDTAFFTGNYSPKFSVQGFSGSENDFESKLPKRDPSMGHGATLQELEEVTQL
jgi:allantoicase